jgi:hypothetical protein
MSDDAEQEYIEAKAAYDVALARLVAARKARPKQPTKAELRLAENQRITDVIWQAYVAGERDYDVLAALVGRSRGWAGRHVHTILHKRQFGPETPQEYELRMTALKLRSDLALQMPGHSEAWHQLYRMHTS